MKRLFCLGLLVLFAFVGCEEGLTSNDESLTEDEKFSFSRMHARIKALEAETERLHQENAEQQELIKSITEGSDVSLGSMTDRISSLTDRIGEIEGYVGTSETMGLRGSVASLNSTFAGVARLNDPVTRQPAIRFSGVNVQIVSGSGSTDGTVNGLGNLIMGYNEIRNSGIADKSGSHNIIVGSMHNYSSYGGLVVGYWNAISGPFSSVSGGYHNTANGSWSCVSGGNGNMADGPFSSVSGGAGNKAFAIFSSVSGGVGNLTGDNENNAKGQYSSISGGGWNKASGDRSSISGGTFISVIHHDQWAVKNLVIGGP